MPIKEKVLIFLGHLVEFYGYMMVVAFLIGLVYATIVFSNYIVLNYIK